VDLDPPQLSNESEGALTSLGGGWEEALLLFHSFHLLFNASCHLNLYSIPVCLPLGVGENRIRRFERAGRGKFHPFSINHYLFLF
jgi:hypothetical protein